jgi:predicted Abi (CAAX) family protease
VLYHPLNALTFYKKGNPTFWQPVFLILSGLLGLICAIAYYFTGSLVIITLIHWLIVVLWLFVFGGEKKLKRRSISSQFL